MSPRLCPTRYARDLLRTAQPKMPATVTCLTGPGVCSWTTITHQTTHHKIIYTQFVINNLTRMHRKIKTMWNREIVYKPTVCASETIQAVTVVRSRDKFMHYFFTILSKLYRQRKCVNCSAVTRKTSMSTVTCNINLKKYRWISPLAWDTAKYVESPVIRSQVPNRRSPVIPVLEIYHLFQTVSLQPRSAPLLHHVPGSNTQHPRGPHKLLRYISAEWMMTRWLELIYELSNCNICTNILKATTYR